MGDTCAPHPCNVGPCPFPTLLPPATSGRVHAGCHARGRQAGPAGGRAGGRGRAQGGCGRGAYVCRGGMHCWYCTRVSRRRRRRLLRLTCALLQIHFADVPSRFRDVPVSEVESRSRPLRRCNSRHAEAGAMYAVVRERWGARELPVYVGCNPSTRPALSLMVSPPLSPSCSFARMQNAPV